MRLIPGAVASIEGVQRPPNDNSSRYSRCDWSASTISTPDGMVKPQSPESLWHSWAEDSWLKSSIRSLEDRASILEKYCLKTRHRTDGAQEIFRGDLGVKERGVMMSLLLTIEELRAKTTLQRDLDR